MRKKQKPSSREAIRKELLRAWNQKASYMDVGGYLVEAAEGAVSLGITMDRFLIAAIESWKSATGAAVKSKKRKARKS